jgi:AcrR family transcriptional regulator
VAAAEAFSLSGFDGITIRDIERRAGVNRGLAAHHFGTKEALWEATIDVMMSDMSDELHRYWDFLALVSTPERGRILLRIYVQFIAKHPEFFRLVLLEGRVDSPRSRVLADRCMRPLEDMFRAATGASPEDSVEDQAIQHFTIFGAASVIFGVEAHAKYLFGVDPRDPAFVERYADAIARMWLPFLDAAQPVTAADDGDRAAA